jgi:dolichyl-phosphate-mannose--protein O-mannosyl transferase
MSDINLESIIKKHGLIIFIPIIIIISYFTYLNNYTNPQALYWDENYYLTSSQKYIDRVFFFESHPPLGKMLIALSEKISGVNKNIDKYYFNGSDFISNVPDGYNFAGVRFPSAFLSFLSSIIFFLILYFLFNNTIISFLFIFLYMFDNALILHYRGAMLDGQQMFFILLAILYFTITIKKESVKIYDYLILGLLVGIVISFKINGLIFSLLFFFLFVIENKDKIFSLKIKVKDLFVFFLKLSASFIGMIFVYFLVFYIHFVICINTVDNSENHFAKYQISNEYKQILLKKQNANPLYFFIMFKDYQAYMKRYHQNVPKLDLCKPGENGSLPVGWPLGIKSINYRWERNDYEAKYLYLQCNPISWLIGLIGFLLSFVLISAKLVFKHQIKNIKIFQMIVVFFVIYVSYMIALLRINRVMYLYHYFIPLVMTFILSYLIFVYIFEELLNNLSKRIYIATSVVFLIVFLSFLWFSPLTYYLPLTKTQFYLRSWVQFWQLISVN